MTALALVLMLAASAEPTPEVAAPTSAEPAFRLSVGGQVGLPHVLGVTALGGFLHEGRRRFDVDLLWEPSVTLQSYSVGGAYHVLDSPFFVGARVRLVQFAPPWQRGGGDAWLGLGLELGGRFPVAGGKGLIHVALHGTWLPSQASNLALLVGLSAGFSWEVWAR
jgi:hypothetical protein